MVQGQGDTERPMAGRPRRHWDARSGGVGAGARRATGSAFVRELACAQGRRRRGGKAGRGVSAQERSEAEQPRRESRIC